MIPSCSNTFTGLLKPRKPGRKRKVGNTHPPTPLSKTLENLLLHLTGRSRNLQGTLIRASTGKHATSGLASWDADDVRTWPLVTGDPVVDARESEWQREWARTHDPDGLARYYSQYQRQAPPRQVPPRQRQSYVPPQQRVSFRPADYADARGFDAHVPP